VPRKILGEVGQADDLVEQLATRTQLENDVVVLLGFGEVDEFDNVGVIELAHNLDLLKDVGSLWGITSVPVLQRLEKVLRGRWRASMQGKIAHLGCFWRLKVGMNMLVALHQNAGW
jgi:hypothetical protein